MKLSHNWLSEFVHLEGLSPEEISAGLTRSTCEVEGFETVYAHLEGVVAVLIVEAKQHPNADRLRVCKVSSGDAEHTIVCGAPNAAAGLIVPLVLPGTTLQLPDGNTLKIKTSKIRGVESAGMLAGADELGLEELFPPNDGLLVLGEGELSGGASGELKINRLNLPGLKSVELGAKLASIVPLTDTIFEIDNKSITHRPDLWSHFGFARELSVIFKRKIIHEPLKLEAPVVQSGLPVKKIEISEKSALGYYGVHCENVTVGPAPLRVQARIYNLGQKPINNLVDASNYLMFEVGQPNHIFDSTQLKSDTITVAPASSCAKREPFAALDGNSYTPPDESILILDGDIKDYRPVALGGVMGGENSSVTEDTTSIFLESATFHRHSIRRTLAALPLRTESAIRFEKGQDPAQALPAIYRLINLVKESSPDLQVGEITSATTEEPLRNQIVTSLEFISSRLGFAVTSDEVNNTLKSLGFEVKVSGAGSETRFEITTPTYRSQHDVTIPEDIVEEIGRIRGYDEIAPQAPPVELNTIVSGSERRLERAVKEFLVAAGAGAETYNYSFLSEEDNRLFNATALKLKNPIFADRPELRVHLIPGLLRQGALNQDRYDEVRLFELGRSYFNSPVSDDPELKVSERKRIALLQIPPAADNAKLKPDERPVYHAFLEQRALLERLFTRFLPGQIVTHPIDPEHKPLFEGSPDSTRFLHPGGAVEWRSREGDVIAVSGILNPVFERRFGLKRPAVTAMIYFNEMAALYEKTRRNKTYSPPSIYPESHFEITVVADSNESSARPVDIINELNIPEINAIELLTIYSGEPLPSDKKAISYRLACGAREGTLSGERLQEILDQVVEALSKNGLPLR